MRYKKKIYGTNRRPRLSVFRSNKHIYAQVIDDSRMKTLISASSLQLKTQKQVAWSVGELLAKKAIKKEIKKVVFDRGRYKYHGKIKQLAEGAREGGLDL